MTTKSIVAEVSKSWIHGQELQPGTGLLCQQFERVIEVNRRRGYKLNQFQLHRVIHGEILNETIIAVFERS